MWFLTLINLNYIIFFGLYLYKTVNLDIVLVYNVKYEKEFTKILIIYF